MLVYGSILCLALLGILVCIIYIAWSWLKDRQASRRDELIERLKLQHWERHDESSPQPNGTVE